MSGFVASGLAAALVTVFVACPFGGLWFAFPFARRRGQEGEQAREDGQGEQRERGR